MQSFKTAFIYGLLRYARNDGVVKFSLCKVMDLQVWANLLTQMCASALPRNDEVGDTMTEGA